MAGEAGIVSVIFEPTFRRVVLHGAQGRMFFLNPDGDGLELGEHVACDEDADALEMVGEEG